jgi:hypothetical protein
MVTDTLVQITAPHFCAALVMRNDRVISAAPILRWTKGKSRSWLRERFKALGYSAHVVQEVKG